MNNLDSKISFESKYMQIELVEKKPRTCIFHIQTGTSGVNGILLGIVKWYPPWRQYCFFTVGNRIFSRGCQNDIIKFIDELMENHKPKMVKIK